MRFGNSHIGVSCTVEPSEDLTRKRDLKFPLALLKVRTGLVSVSTFQDGAVVLMGENK
jgi:hypothetical protein